MRKLAYSIVATALALGAGVARADAPPPAGSEGYYLRDYQEITQSAPTQPWLGLTFDLVVKLGLVIGLIYLTMWALRTYVLAPQSKRGAVRLTGRLEVLDTTHLAPNRTVYLVEVADRVLVLGATATALSTLAEIREPAAIDLLKARQGGEGTAAHRSDFADHLRSMTTGLPGSSSGSGFLSDKIGELRSLTTHLRRPTEETHSP